MKTKKNVLEMLEPRRLIICATLLLFNLCVLVWRMSLERWNEDFDPQEMKWFDYNHQRNSSIDPSLEFLTSIESAWQMRPFPGPNEFGANVSDDSHRLIDLLDFEYTLQQPACSQNILGLIMVHSAPKNSEKRRWIRGTWANRSLLRVSPLRVLFLFGSDRDAGLQGKLVQENEKYGDMVQGNFIDDYRNMTYKHVMALKWFRQRCAHAQLLIKVDDDIFVNTPKLLRYAQSPPQNDSDAATPEGGDIELFNQPKGLLLCSKISGSLVKRSYHSKWRVSFQEYPYRYYPPYCFGFAIIYSSDVAARLYESAQYHKFFWIDDVHITGIMAQLNGIEITNFSNHLLTAPKRDKLLVARLPQSKDCELDFLFAEHGTTLEEMSKLWELIELQKPQEERSAQKVAHA